ncbi:hypothetical protein L210DRAFT_3521557 [Boletus edulis BED1]|uniref:Uncharacterized protein n=1 Tax=Boletus edulis BED1 TaxID=1328754 RepID=A0AAD4C6X9_BOLED|nr:hypothetical protein L210DRAFT_3521557 [Boletus edulis BED1]
MSQAPLAPDSESMPTAAAWIQSRLTALYETDVAGVQDVFDRTFSPLCEVRLNHVVQPLQTFRDDVAARRTAATHVSVAWGLNSFPGASHSDEGVVSTNEDKPKEPAVVAGALVVTRSLPFRIRVSPAQRQTYIYFSARIERDLGVQGGDPRRITSFYYTSVDKTPPIHFTVHAQPKRVDPEGQ